MIPAEFNQIYEVFMMINSSLEVIIKRAKSIRADCSDKHMYHAQLKLNCRGNVKDILDIAESIEKRKGPALTLIEEQRKAFRSEI